MIDLNSIKIIRLNLPRKPVRYTPLSKLEEKANAKPEANLYTSEEVQKEAGEEPQETNPDALEDDKNREELQRARRPVSYAKASCAYVGTEALSETQEPCEGRAALRLPSPSNPTHQATLTPAEGSIACASADESSTSQTEAFAAKPSHRTATLTVRCTPAEKEALKAKAELLGVTATELLREALGLELKTAKARSRRRPIPKADPAILRGLARMGINLNQIARVLNSAHKAGQISTVSLVRVSSELIGVERQLSGLREDAVAGRLDHESDQDTPPC
jgi:hypothetical protein